MKPFLTQEPYKKPTGHILLTLELKSKAKDRKEQMRPVNFGSSRHPLEAMNAKPLSRNDTCISSRVFQLQHKGWV